MNVIPYFVKNLSYINKFNIHTEIINHFKNKIKKIVVLSIFYVRNIKLYQKEPLNFKMYSVGDHECLEIIPQNSQLVYESYSINKWFTT